MVFTEHAQEIKSIPVKDPKKAPQGPCMCVLVDHAEADAREAPVEVGEKLGEGRAVRLHLLPLVGVGRS